MKKQFIIATISKVLQKILVFGQGIIIARILFAEGTGKIAAYMAVYELVINLTTFGVPNSSAYYLTKKRWDATTISMIHSFVLVFGGILTCIALIAALSFQSLLNNYVILMILIVKVFIYKFVSSSSSIALANKWIEVLVLREFIVNLLSFIFVAVFIWFLRKPIEWVFGAILFSEFLSLSVVFPWLSKVEGYKIKLNFKGIKKVLSPFFKKGIMYALPLFVFGLNYKADIVILGHFVEKSDIGYYSVAVSLSVLLWFLPEVYMRIVLSHSFASEVEKERAFSKRIFKNTLKIMFVSSFVVFMIYVLAPIFIPLIYGSEFVVSIKPFKVLLLGTFMMMGFQMLNGDLIGKGRPEIALYIFSITAVLNIVGNIAFIPEYGIIGAAWTSTGTYFLGSLGFIVVYYFIAVKDSRRI